MSAIRRLAIPALLAGLVVATLIALGNWQMRRLEWKLDLIESVERRPFLPVADLPSRHYWTSMGPGAFQYRPYRLDGRYLHDREAWVFTSLPDPKGRFGGPGYWIMTPFELNAGGIVWINRGFAPQGRHTAAGRKEALGENRTMITGLLRPDETLGWFTPDDAPAQNIFYARNTEKLAIAKGLRPPVAPFTIDLSAEHTPTGGLPQAGETRTRFSNRHLGYALTWYGLALACLAIFVLFARSRLYQKAP